MTLQRLQIDYLKVEDCIIPTQGSSSTLLKRDAVEVCRIFSMKLISPSRWEHKQYPRLPNQAKEIQGYLRVSTQFVTNVGLLYSPDGTNVHQLRLVASEIYQKCLVLESLFLERSRKMNANHECEYTNLGNHYCRFCYDCSNVASMVCAFTRSPRNDLSSLQSAQANRLFQLSIYWRQACSQQGTDITV